MKGRETYEAEEREESETLPLRQRAESNEGGRQSRTMLSHSRTKRGGASWESEAYAATDAMLDKHAMPRAKIKTQTHKP